MAQQEDLWDRILSEKCAFVDTEPKRSWSHEIRLALEENARLQGVAIQRRVDIATKMHSIVEAEKVLVGKEKKKTQARNAEPEKLPKLTLQDTGALVRVEKDASEEKASKTRTHNFKVQMQDTD